MLRAHKRQERPLPLVGDEHAPFVEKVQLLTDTPGLYPIEWMSPVVQDRELLHDAGPFAELHAAGETRALVVAEEQQPVFSDGERSGPAHSELPDARATLTDSDEGERRVEVGPDGTVAVDVGRIGITENLICPGRLLLMDPTS